MSTLSLTARDSRRLQIAAQAVIVSARLSDNSTGINWRRLPATPIGEHYLTEYPGLTNQEIAFRETLEEVERRVLGRELDLDRVDNAGLQERIEDVLNDILDFMVHDAQASSSDGESDTTDSSDSGDSDDSSDYDHPNMSRADSTHHCESDAAHQAHQHQRPHHEAGHANRSISSRASSRIQGPHLPPDAIHPISVSGEEHVSASNAQLRRNEDEARGTQERGATCCSAM